MHIKLFVKEDCPKCPAAKKALEGFEAVEVYDLDSVDGLAEAAYHSVLSTPSILVFGPSGGELASWRGQIPDPSAIRALAN